MNNFGIAIRVAHSSRPWAGMISSFQDFGLSLAASAAWFDFWIEDEHENEDDFKMRQ